MPAPPPEPPLEDWPDPPAPGSASQTYGYPGQLGPVGSCIANLEGDPPIETTAKDAVLGFIDVTYITETRWFNTFRAERAPHFDQDAGTEEERTGQRRTVRMDDTCWTEERVIVRTYVYQAYHELRKFEVWVINQTRQAYYEWFTGVGGAAMDLGDLATAGGARAAQASAKGAADAAAAAAGRAASVAALTQAHAQAVAGAAAAAEAMAAELAAAGGAAAVWQAEALGLGVESAMAAEASQSAAAAEVAAQKHAANMAKLLRGTAATAEVLGAVGIGLLLAQAGLTFYIYWSGGSANAAGDKISEGWAFFRRFWDKERTLVSETEEWRRIDEPHPCTEAEKTGAAVTIPGIEALIRALGTRWWLWLIGLLALGMAAGTAGAVLLTGEDEGRPAAVGDGAPEPQPTPSPGQTPSPPAAPTPGIVTGTYSGTVSILSDPAGHRCCVQVAGTWQVLQLRNTRTNEVTIQITELLPGIQLTGNPPAIGAPFRAAGTGTVAGFPNVEVVFEGTATAEEGLNGVLTVGSNGALPEGLPITYRVQMAKQP